MSTELKPCPFCGEPGFIHSVDYPMVSFYAACTSLKCFCCLGESWDMDAMPDHRFTSEGEAIEAWNRRADK